MPSFRLVAVLSLLSLAVGAQTTDVEVLNNVDHPVPVYGRGGTIGVQNTPANPLSVTSQQAAEQSSMVATGKCTATGQLGITSLFTLDLPLSVPAGFRFFIDSFSLYASGIQNNAHAWATAAVTPIGVVVPLPLTVENLQGQQAKSLGANLTGWHFPVDKSGSLYVQLRFDHLVLVSNADFCSGAVVGHYVPLAPASAVP